MNEAVETNYGRTGLFRRDSPVERARGPRDHRNRDISGDHQVRLAPDCSYRIGLRVWYLRIHMQNLVKHSLSKKKCAHLQLAMKLICTYIHPNYILLDSPVAKHQLGILQTLVPKYGTDISNNKHQHRSESIEYPQVPPPKVLFS